MSGVHDAATLRSWASGGRLRGGGGSLSFIYWLGLFSPTLPYGTGRCVCACGWEDRVEEGPSAKRRASHAAAWRSCQDSAAGAATAEAAPVARASDALQVQNSQSEASSTTIGVPLPAAVLLRAAK